MFSYSANRKCIKALTVLVLTCLVLAALGECRVFAAAGKTDEAGHIGYSVRSDINSLKVKWKKKSGVRRWVLYRADVTRAVDSDLQVGVRKSAYKKIASLKGSCNSYVDLKVKRHHYYEYILKGYKKAGGKYRLAYTSYLGGVTYFDCPGLARPDLLNGGRGESYSNSGNKIYLYVEPKTGMDPQGVIAYRKGPGEKKYSKIKIRPVEKPGFSGVFLDRNVKAGRSYKYYVRTYIKVDGKTYYSRKSAPVRVKAEAPQPEE